MASPFRHFRKHSKAFMATAAVICMFLFVFASGTGRGRSGNVAREAGATVATWNGGSINQRELGNLVHNRLVTNEFLRRLFSQGGGQSYSYDLPQSMLALLLRSERVDYVELKAIDDEVVSHLATQAGMSVSDDMINHCMETFALKNVSPDEMIGILAGLGQGDSRVNEAIVFNTLRKMLLAFFYRQAYLDAGFVVLPEERWQDWRRVNERISLEAAVLPVESFEKDLPAPTDVQLQSLYNEFKDVEPHRWLTVDGRDMPSATPGFAEPRRVRLEFLLGSVVERTEKQLDKVTDAEIADYYERNKRSEFVKMDFGAAEDQEQDAAAPEEKDETDANPAAEAPAGSEEAPATDGAAEAAPAGAGEAPVEARTPSEGQPAAAEGAPPASDAAPTGNQGAASGRTGPFRLAAYQAEGNEPAAPPAADQPASAAEPAASTDAAAAATPPAEDKDEADGSAAAPADEPQGNADDAALAPPPAKAEDIVEFEPLEKVRDDIRQTLARDKAVAELERIMSEAAAQLQAEYNRYGSSVIAAKEAEREAPAPPERLTNLKWLADKYGLTVDKTAALTDRELFDTAVGKAADVARGAVSATAAAFTTLQLYEPFLAKELEGDWYLVMKTEDQARHVPTLAEARDRVIAEWKLREAATLAEKKAKELAEEATKAGQPFEEFFKSKGYEVIPQTELFSWRTLPVDPDSGAPPVLSEVPKLKYVGPEFMQAAFALGVGGSAGVLNFDHSIAYVIKLGSRQYTETELKELFLEEDRFWPGKMGTLLERQQAFAGVVEREIQDRAGLKLDDEWLKIRAKRGQAE